MTFLSAGNTGKRKGGSKPYNPNSNQPIKSSMNRNQDHLIRGYHEVNNLLRKIVTHYDTYGNLNASDMRSLNYITERLNALAIREGMPEALLRYPKDQ